MQRYAAADLPTGKGVPDIHWEGGGWAPDALGGQEFRSCSASLFRLSYPDPHTPAKNVRIGVFGRGRIQAYFKADPRDRGRLHYATSRKVAGSSPDEVSGFISLPNPSARTMPLGSQPLTEISTRNILGGKGRPACRADNLTAICEPIV
jgi:hypothetical protein